MQVMRDVGLVLCCSGFLIAETARECDDRSGGCTDNMAWGVACGVICFLISLGWILLLRFFAKDNPDRYRGMPQKIVCGFLWGATHTPSSSEPLTTAHSYVRRGCRRAHIR